VGISWTESRGVSWTGDCPIDKYVSPGSKASFRFPEGNPGFYYGDLYAKANNLFEVSWTGRCEEIELQMWCDFGVKKSRTKMPYKRSLASAYILHQTRNLENSVKNDFFTSSSIPIAATVATRLRRWLRLTKSGDRRHDAYPPENAALGMLSPYLPKFSCFMLSSKQSPISDCVAPPFNGVSTTDMFPIT
jgi:hypothetical protein